jgi:hypothetical protein
MADNSIPKKTKNLLFQISDKYPKTGCISDEHTCDKLIINVDTARVIPKFSAKNGIIGFTNPEYTSTVACPAHNVFIAFLFVFSIIINCLKIYFLLIIK